MQEFVDHVEQVGLGEGTQHRTTRAVVALLYARLTTPPC